MNAADIIISVLLAAAVAGAVLVIRKGRNRPSCHGCDGCVMGRCHDCQIPETKK